jgi:hypothetical protein
LKNSSNGEPGGNSGMPGNPRGCSASASPWTVETLTTAGVTRSTRSAKLPGSSWEIAWGAAKALAGSPTAPVRMVVPRRAAVATLRRRPAE